MFDCNYWEERAEYCVLTHACYPRHKTAKTRDTNRLHLPEFNIHWIWCPERSIHIAGIAHRYCSDSCLWICMIVKPHYDPPDPVEPPYGACTRMRSEDDHYLCYVSCYLVGQLWQEDDERAEKVPRQYINGCLFRKWSNVWCKLTSSWRRYSERRGGPSTWWIAKKWCEMYRSFASSAWPNTCSPWARHVSSKRDVSKTEATSHEDDRTPPTRSTLSGRQHHNGDFVLWYKRKDELEFTVVSLVNQDLHEYNFGSLKSCDEYCKIVVRIPIIQACPDFRDSTSNILDIRKNVRGSDGNLLPRENDFFSEGSILGKKQDKGLSGGLWIPPCCIEVGVTQRTKYLTSMHRTCCNTAVIYGSEDGSILVYQDGCLQLLYPHTTVFSLKITILLGCENTLKYCGTRHEPTHARASAIPACCKIHKVGMRPKECDNVDLRCIYWREIDSMNRFKPEKWLRDMVRENKT